MSDHDYRSKGDIPEQIRSAVKHALDSMDFGQLNQSIEDTVNTALDKVKQMKVQTVRPKPLEIRVNKRGMVSGILFTIFGSIGSVGFTTAALVIMAAVAIPFKSDAGWWLVGGLGSIAMIFCFMLLVGIRNNNRIGRLKEYIKELKAYGKPYCELQRLENNSPRSINYIRKDIKKMLQLGMLPDARLDDQETCLLLNEETYRQYRLTQDSLMERQQEDKRLEAKKEVQETEQKGPVGESIARGREYMETLDRLRESISDQEMAGKLVRLDIILEQLFDALRKYPEQLDEMDRFMEYYLPTTVKLVTSYQEFAAVEFPGENVKKAKKEIQQTMDTINGAFEKLLDDFYQDKTFDVLSDASVLQSMLAREGLTVSDFKRDED